MIVHDDELALARAYDSHRPFEGLTEEQVLRIMTRGRELYHWFKDHSVLHNLINATLLVAIFSADYWVQVELPALLLPVAGAATATVVMVAVLSGALHSWIMYSLGVLSLHEGAAHHLVFPPRGPVSRLFDKLAANLSRLGSGEPVEYARNHMSHHAHFGTKEDGEFLNFVRPQRYWRTFLPLALDVNYSDFIVHRPLQYTRGRLVSGLIATTYHGLYAWYAWTHFGLLFTIVAYLVVLPHFGFLIDRLRQFTEHNLMPLNNRNGTRSFGLGFWGLFVGGGPWGQPCHWEHHLVPSIPWYQQIILHRYIKGLLTPRQRQQFLIEPIVGFPKLWWRTIRETHRFSSRPVDKNTAAANASIRA